MLRAPAAQQGMLLLDMAVLLRDVREYMYNLCLYQTVQVQLPKTAWTSEFDWQTARTPSIVLRLKNSNL
jgi:hypothetical protein